jgi:pimeloyl-ACP methyl ester carboxylesterase
MIREKRFDTGAVKINYAEGPASGHPLVLIHGGGGCWQNLNPIIPSLATRWQIFAVDLRGHGRSDRVPGHYLPKHYVTDLIAFLDSQVTGPMVLFGHSLGGWIALLSAVKLREKVRGLILGDPPLNIERFVEVESGEERVKMWQALRETAEQLDPDIVFYHATGRISEYVEGVDPDAALAQLSCPTLLLQGNPSLGGIILDDEAEHALSLLSKGLHVKLEKSGHGLGLNPEEVAPLLGAITSFLESL